MITALLVQLAAKKTLTIAAILSKSYYADSIPIFYSNDHTN